MPLTKEVFFVMNIKEKYEKEIGNLIEFLFMLTENGYMKWDKVKNRPYFFTIRGGCEIIIRPSDLVVDDVEYKLKPGKSALLYKMISNIFFKEDTELQIEKINYLMCETEVTCINCYKKVTRSIKTQDWIYGAGKDAVQL